MVAGHVSVQHLLVHIASSMVAMFIFIITIHFRIATSEEHVLFAVFQPQHITGQENF